MLLMTMLLTLLQAVPMIESVAQGRTSSIEEPQQSVVRTDAEWRELWKLHAGVQQMPQVDFTKSMVVGVFLGIRPTGGYGVEITGARRDGGALVVEYVEQRPRPDAILTQALTAPFHIVALPRHEGPVTFRSTPAQPALR